MNWEAFLHGISPINAIAPALFWCVEYVDPAQSTSTNGNNIVFIPRFDAPRSFRRLSPVRKMAFASSVLGEIEHHVDTVLSQKRSAHESERESERTHTQTNERIRTESFVRSDSLTRSARSPPSHCDTIRHTHTISLSECAQSCTYSARRLIHITRTCICVCFGNRLHELFRMRPDQS